MVNDDEGRHVRVAGRKQAGKARARERERESGFAYDATKGNILLYPGMPAVAARTKVPCLDSSLELVTARRARQRMRKCMVVRIWQHHPNAMRRL